MKKKYTLKNKNRFYSLIIVFTLLLSAAFFASSAYGYDGAKYETISVTRGDTLWNIAEKYGSGKDIRRYIFEIKKANNLDSSVIYEGTDLKIPL